MVAEGALFGGVGYRMQKSRAIWASLDAIPAADAVALVNEHDTILRSERGAHRQTCTQGALEH